MQELSARTLCFSEKSLGPNVLSEKSLGEMSCGLKAVGQMQ
jgi:hypothetical protein